MKRLRLLQLALGSFAAACSSPSPGTDAGDVNDFYAYDVTGDLPPLGDGQGSYDASLAGSAQDPPTTTPADIEAWIATGAYRSWHCEATQHPARPPSPHSINRICTNDALSTFTGTGEYPVGSAAVKEIFDPTGAMIAGYAVYRHVRAGTTGSDWYYYERVPLYSAAPHDANGVVAAGPGTDGPARSICVACHMAAGSDAMHSGHDFVYTQVP